MGMVKLLKGILVALSREGLGLSDEKALFLITYLLINFCLFLPSHCFIDHRLLTEHCFFYTNESDDIDLAWVLNPNLLIIRGRGNTKTYIPIEFQRRSRHPQTEVCQSSFHPNFMIIYPITIFRLLY